MATSVSSSSFSKLLRQSKFASYDPAINQAYTSFGGYSHRGHWGTKRDLPPKRKNKLADPLVSTSGARGSARRNPVAFIASLDSAEGQTEWSSAEKDVRSLRRLEELGTGAQLRSGTAWSRRVGWSRSRVGATDSEFDTPGTEEKVELQATSALPNTLAMSERRFQSYLARLRTQRQEFHEFLQDLGVGQFQNEDSTIRGAFQVVPMYHFAQGPTSFHTRFLAYTNQKAAVQPASRTLTPVPHPAAGLEYVNPSQLMSRLLYPNPTKGRFVQSNSRSLGHYPVRFEDASIVTIAGFNANLVQSGTPSQPIDWQKLVAQDFSQPTERTISEYRVQKLEINAVPRVVGKLRENIDSTNIKMHLHDWSKFAEGQSNPHRPGSVEYVSHVDDRTTDAAPQSLRRSIVSPVSSTQGIEYTNPSVEMMDLLDDLLAQKIREEKKS